VKHIVAIAFIFLAGAFRTAAADLIEECRRHPWSDVRLRACTEIIISPSYGPDAKVLAYQSRGDARTNAGAFEQAIADFGEAIRLRPDNVPALSGRARAKFSLKRFSDALDDYGEAIRLSPAAADLYVERGHVHLSRGDANASILDLNEAIKLDPRNASAFNNRGLAFRKNGDFDRALNDYVIAIEINPVYALAYANRGHLQAARGQTNAAIDDLQQALLLDPSLVSARNTLKRLGSLPSAARESDRRVREGRDLAEKYCSNCHAVGVRGRSTNGKAPEFRNLTGRHTLLALREPITRGIAAPHDEMPRYAISDAQVDAIVAYINSLSRKR
jgi:tetratricopeptide (TPR) repeat protein